MGAIDEGLKDGRIFLRIIFEVAVLDQNDVSSGFLDADADGRSFTQVEHGMVDADAGAGIVLVEDFGGPVD